jgi:hypothetical protein
MGMVVARIEMPPVKGSGSTPTDEEMQAEQEAHERFMEAIGPKLKGLASQPPRRTGNIVRIELFGGGEWSMLNQYLLMVTTDIGEPRIDWAELVPDGGKSSVVATGLRHVQTWPDEEES